jgi:hypothetical protein
VPRIQPESTPDCQKLDWGPEVKAQFDRLSTRQERFGIAHTFQQSMHIKDRLTVTVDAELAAHARQVAHSRGTSVSGLLESLLREALASRPRRSHAFADRWSGQFSVTPNTSGDARLAALKAKHSLE